MDTHTQNDPNNPINYKETQEDREHAKNELMRDTLQQLTIKYLGEDATDFYNNEDLGGKDSHEIFGDLSDSGFFDVEVIYYHKAMNYLTEYDYSLCESIEIATEYGYILENINSELLASLHASEKRRNDFFEYVAPELEKIINN